MIDVKKLANIADLKKFAPSEVIIREGSPDNNGMYILLAGKVSVVINYGTSGQTELAELGPGQMFGEMSMFSNKPRSATNVAKEAVTTVFLTRENFLEFVAKNAEVAFQIIADLCERQYNFNRAFGAQTLQLSGKTKEEVEAEQAEEEAVRKPVALPPGIKTTYNQFIKIDPPPAQNRLSIKQGREICLPEHSFFGLMEPDEYRKHVSQSKMFCPVCDAIIVNWQIMESELKHISCTPDLRVLHQNFDETWYDIQFCPACYYAALRSSFGRVAKERKKMLQIALQNLRRDVEIKFSPTRDIDEILLKYYVALFCAPYGEDVQQNQLKLWQRIHWLYEDAGNEKLAADAARQAIFAAKQIHSKSLLDDKGEQEVCIIAGELALKTDDRVTAKEFFVHAAIKKEANADYLAQAMERLRLL